MFAWLGDEQATAQRRAELWRLLGPRSRREGGVKGHCLCRELHDSSAQVEHWLLDLHRAPAVPALLVLPPEGRVPRGAVLYGHAHGNSFDVGKDELLDGRPALQQPPYGPVLAARGWVALAIDHCGFGERRDPAERALAKRALWQGETLWGWRLQDTLAALDWLRMQPGLGALPVVALGLSMGGTMALWATALDPRIAGCAELCCSAEYDALLASGCFDLHGEYFFVPGLLTEFTLAEIAALIARVLRGRDDDAAVAQARAEVAALCARFPVYG